MQKLIYKLISFAMALLLLFSTSSFAMDMHYCGDHLVSVSLLNNLDDCGMKMQQEEHTQPAEVCTTQIKARGCCSNKHFQSDGQEELQAAVEQLPVDQQLFLAGFVYSYHILFTPVVDKPVSFRPYRPPNLETDFQVLLQTFLI